MPKLCDGLIQIALVERGAPFGDVQVDILVAIVSGGKFTTLLEFLRALVLASRTRQGQPQLVVGFAALRIESRGFLQFLNRFRHFSVLQERLAQGQVGAGEGWGDADHLSQQFDLFRSVLGLAP